MPHLKACLPELTNMLHGVQGTVEDETRGEVSHLPKGQGREHGDSITGPYSSFKVSMKERLNTGQIPYYSSLDVVLKAERVGVATGWEEAISKLEGTYEALRAHASKKKVALGHRKCFGRLALE